jgi:hypothetical protein
LTGQTSTIARRGIAPVRGAVARGADHAASTEPPGARVVERSPALLRQVNELMREGRRGYADPEQIPFFCECRRADCYEPVWLTGDMYDERYAEAREPLILPGHEHARGEAQWPHAGSVSDVRSRAQARRPARHRAES